MRRGIRLCHQGSVAARLGLARLVSRLVGAGAITLARRLVTVITGGGFERQHEEILAPIRRLPAHERALLRWMWTQPKFFDALGSQIASICTSAEEALSAPLSIDTLPLVVVSATAPHPHHVAMQERLARMSRRGRRLVAPASGHWVPLDAPAFVAEVVTSMVDDLRRPGP
jgi:pimeloyl-ACP methyl ester carboxylesterase